MSLVVIVILISIIYRLFFKSDDRPFTPEELAEQERLDQSLAELREILGPIEYNEPELEESDIEGVYFNEFGEYVDEEGHVLSSAELYNAKHRVHIWDEDH